MASLDDAALRRDLMSLSTAPLQDRQLEEMRQSVRDLHTIRMDLARFPRGPETMPPRTEAVLYQTHNLRELPDRLRGVSGITSEFDEHTLLLRIRFSAERASSMGGPHGINEMMRKFDRDACYVRGPSDAPSWMFKSTPPALLETTFADELRTEVDSWLQPVRKELQKYRKSLDKTVLV